MRDIIVFGNVPLATWVVKALLENRSFNLIGVVCDEYEEDAFIHHGMKEKSLFSFSKKNDIKIIKFEEAGVLAKDTPILGISVRYNKIFKRNYFKYFTPGIINLHGGELPRYRGANIANYAVYENATRVGGTLHFIAEGIDEGDIVERELISIDGKPTAFDFFTLTIDALKQAFTRFIEREDVINDLQKIKAIPQIEFEKNGEINKLYFKKEIEEKRLIEFNSIDNWDDLYRKARAYTFPNQKGLIIKNKDEFIEIKVVKDVNKK